MVSIDSVRNLTLEDDDSPHGGVAFDGETVWDFLCDVGEDGVVNGSLVDVDKLNDLLKECGIKPIPTSYLEKTIVELSTEDDIRMIHYFAFGYYNEMPQNEKKPYQFVEYTWFVVPLKDAVEMGLREFESEYQDQYKHYVTDCETCAQLYEHYNNGKMPKLIRETDVNMDTPDGFYILL